MLPPLDIPTSAHPVTARDIAYATVAREGFQVSPIGEYSAVGQRGSSLITSTFGYLTDRASQLVRVQINTFALGDAGAVVRVSRVRADVVSIELGVSPADRIVAELQSLVAAVLPAPAAPVSGAGTSDR